jgi:hypothetical protein
LNKEGLEVVAYVALLLIACWVFSGEVMTKLFLSQRFIPAKWKERSYNFQEGED